MNLKDFSEVAEISFSDEGELVRYFRMIAQLLREIRGAKCISDELKANAKATFEKMNRGIVNAERQLKS